MLSSTIISRSRVSVSAYSLQSHIRGRCLRTTGAVAASFDQKRGFRSEGARAEEKQTKDFFPVYVHHVSKVTLEYLQNGKSDWLIEKGLDRGLQINSNGTFVLNFPSKKGFDAGKIWTSYDSSKKQHWLSIYKGKLAVRFLLKDHGGQYLKTTEAINASDPNRMIELAVDQLISSVERSL
jgi:hypothetical protein